MRARSSSGAVSVASVKRVSGLESTRSRTASGANATAAAYIVRGQRIEHVAVGIFHAELARAVLLKLVPLRAVIALKGPNAIFGPMEAMNLGGFRLRRRGGRRVLLTVQTKASTVGWSARRRLNNGGLFDWQRFGRFGCVLVLGNTV